MVLRPAGLVAMAGAATVPGNVTPSAEFNVWADPEAAELERVLDILLEDHSATRAARIAARITGFSRRAVYRTAVKRRQAGSGEAES